MIKALISLKDNTYSSFSCTGHAEYAEKGSDIICAAVSTLVINTGNSIEKFTDCKFNASMNKNLIEFVFLDKPDEKACLLMDSMVLGLKEIQKEYGKKYLDLVIQ